jgi:hypothetical protein
MTMAIALIAIFRLIGTDRSLFAITDRPHLVGGNSESDESFFGFGSAAVAQTQVVFG